METRKVQTVGGGTHTVSLPKEWTRSAGVDTGSIVELHTHIDDVLVIQPQARETGAVTTVEIPLVNDDPTFIERALRAGYATGFREVVLVGSDGLTDEQRRTLERVARTLTGVAVTEETDQRVTVASMLDAGEVSVRQSVRQLQFVALSMHREATAALTAGTEVENPADRDDQADRLYALVDRYFRRGLSRLDEIDALGLTRPELFTLWSTARELERIADHAERIATLAVTVTCREATAEELDRIAETARGVVTDAVGAALGDAGLETVRSTLRTRDRVREDITDLEQRLFEAPDTDYRLARVLDGLSRTAEHGGTIAELGLQELVRDGQIDRPTERMSE